MSVTGFLACKTCLEYVWMGKWLRHDDDNGFGFWPGYTKSHEELGLKTLNFLAKHMSHEIVIQQSGEFEIWAEIHDPEDKLRSVGDELSATWPEDEVKP